ncbi:MAG: isoprenyl transferase [Paludibacteraceae bacterium]|nr:isoprenyl transferase [Paludibacteraceae bacterium]
MNTEDIRKDRMPRHVAVIMDGNGRWAKQHGLARALGHKQGVNTLHEITETAARLGIGYLTMYAFSTENWNRPQDEIDALMALLVSTIATETPTLMKNNVRLLTIGDMQRLPQDVRTKIENCKQQTAANTGLNLVIALSYSARWEITEAARQLATAVANGQLLPQDINEQRISDALTTHAIPDPDLLIRTSGELRISNFLLWQLAYSELWFTDKLWPDFTADDFCNALRDYQKRERRFGKTSEQLKNN